MRHLILLFTLLVSSTSCAAEKNHQRNVILFLGDGMGVSTVTAARIHAGQLAGGSGEEYQLAFDKFPNVALVKTYNVDRQVPDSAGTMSAIMTGQPGRFGLLSTDASVERGDCTGAMAKPVTTLLERAEQAGFKTGVVTTTQITHATPGATYAHAPERGWESDAKMPPEAKQAGCLDIAQQLVNFDLGDGIEVLLGGGRSKFLPVSKTDPEYPEFRGERLDGRDLIAEWLAADGQRQYIWNLDQFEALDPHKGGPVLGLFEPGHMQFEIDRSQSESGPTEPSIAQMTEFAIRRLQGGEKGFFLMVEGGRIDHAHHGTNAARALTETVMMDRAVARALELTDPANTLILVTADHSHTLTISGYPPRGNPILGKVPLEVASDVQEIFQRPYTTLGYTNGPGYQPDIPNLTEVDTTDSDYRQYAGWPLPSETHGGEDVAAYAHGLGAERLRGVIEQRRIYNVMASALFDE
jgi:alkaline phosphatase